MSINDESLGVLNCWFDNFFFFTFYEQNNKSITCEKNCTIFLRFLSFIFFLTGIKGQRTVAVIYCADCKSH